MKELRQFVEVAGRRSISLAARHLNISQSALSRAMQKLEESYGAPLFVRTGGGMELSPSGATLYGHALRVLPLLDQAREEIEQLQGRSRASIRIVAGDLWGFAILPAVMSHFAGTNPDVVVHLSIADESKRLEGLRNGTFDLAFGTLSTRYGAALDVVFEPLTQQGTNVYCDLHHPLAKKDVVSTEELTESRWISTGYDDPGDTALPGRQWRDYAVRADTLLTALQILKGSQFLMAGSSGFAGLFQQYGIVPLALKDVGARSHSGAIYFERTLSNPSVSRYLATVRRATAT
jgi:DNA-binding transcriptional LysR family regulator